MSEKHYLQRWDRLVTALENEVSRMSDDDILSLPASTQRAQSFRTIIDSALKKAGSTGIERGDAPHIPNEASARRELLRSMLSRRAVAPHSASASFSSADEMSDGEVEEMLLKLLRKGILK